MGSKSAIDFPVVGIGASAGELEALLELARAIPSDSGLCNVIVQHLAACPLLTIKGGRFVLHDDRKQEGIRTPIDRLLTSLPEEVGQEAYCVIHSGKGSDETGALKVGAEGQGFPERETLEHEFETTCQQLEVTVSEHESSDQDCAAPLKNRIP